MYNRPKPRILALVAVMCPSVAYWAGHGEAMSQEETGSRAVMAAPAFTPPNSPQLRQVASASRQPWWGNQVRHQVTHAVVKGAGPHHTDNRVAKTSKAMLSYLPTFSSHVSDGRELLFIRGQDLATV